MTWELVAAAVQGITSGGAIGFGLIAIVLALVGLRLEAAAAALAAFVLACAWLATTVMVPLP